MSQDPQSGYNPNPEKPYTDPSSYEIPSLPPSGEPPSPNPYQDPPQTYYGEYQPLHYDVPPQGAYGTPGYDPNQGGYGYNPNQGDYGYQASSPLPLGEAINQLPNQYIKVVTKPSPFTFAAEMGKASWDILWVQLIAYAVIASILAYIYKLMPWAAVSYNTQSNLPPSLISLSKNIELFTSIGLIVIIPISFFIGQGITYLIAKAFGGTGTFLRQGYTYLLITVPLGIISYVLAFIPYLGIVASIGLGFYGIVLQIFALMPVHGLSGGKATAVVLIPIGVAILLCIVLIIILAIVLVIALQSSPSPYSP